MTPDQPAHPFLPDAMLPAWVVTSPDLRIRHCNRFASELLGNFGFNDPLGRQPLSLRLNARPSEDSFRLWAPADVDSAPGESLWSIFAPDAHDFITAGLIVLERHLATLSEFSGSFPVTSLAGLVSALRSVRGDAGVKPYVFDPSQVDDQLLVVGIRISPPEGLRLSRETTVGDTSLNFADVAMAYQIKLALRYDIATLTFNGVQLALHDATERHELWTESRLLAIEQGRSEQLQIFVHQTAYMLAQPWLDPARPSMAPWRQVLLWEAKTLVTEILSRVPFRNPTRPIHGDIGTDFPEWPSDMPVDQLLRRLIHSSLDQALARSTRRPTKNVSEDHEDRHNDIVREAWRIINSGKDPAEELRKRIGFDWLVGTLPGFIRCRGFGACFHHCFWQAAHHAFISSFDQTTECHLWLRCSESRMDIFNREGSREIKGHVQGGKSTDKMFFDLLNEKMAGRFIIRGPDPVVGANTWLTSIEYHHD